MQLWQQFYHIFHTGETMQLDMDYSRTIANLNAKLERQRNAVAQTEAEIAGFKQLQELQKKTTK